MAKWTAPFHAPKFTDEQFEREKKKYNAANGFKVTFPALSDVIHLRSFTPMTDEEIKLWTGNIPSSEIPNVYLSPEEINDWINTHQTPAPSTRRPTAAEQAAFRANLKNSIPPERFQEISEEKQRKRDKFQAMMDSPSPEFLRSAGAILTALDDTQDALSTLACAGMIIGAIAGPTAAALLAGPVGWLAGAAALLNLLNPMSAFRKKGGVRKTGRRGKKDLENFSDRNPSSKKARAKIAKNMAKFRPSLGNAIEALQVTEGVFGVGISIGPIMGLVQDIAAGAVRQISGDKVQWKTAPPTYPKYVKIAQKALKAQSVVHGVPWKSDITDEVSSILAANLALQIITPWLKDWNPLEQVDGVADLITDVPQPTDPLTLEIIKESGHSIDEVCNWPQNGQKSILMGTLQAITEPLAKANFVTFSDRGRNSAEAYCTAQQANDFALGSIEAIEGDGSVVIDYSVIERIVLIIMDNDWAYPDNITDEQIAKFESWCYSQQEINHHPSFSEIQLWSQRLCGFSWIKSYDIYV